MSVEEARVWFAQARSDYRAATALLAQPGGMQPEDVGCHVAAMCAQAIEKSIKGYLIVSGHAPALDHRPDKYLALLLTKGGRLLRYGRHYPRLSKLFGPPTKHHIRELFDLTPGGKGKRTDLPNTEYPWQVGGAWAKAPAGSPSFRGGSPKRWRKLAGRVLDVLDSLMSEAELGAGL